MKGWLAPALLYALATGAIGVTAKIALRSVSWRDLVLWTAIAYGLVAVALAVLGDARLPLGKGGAMSLLSGFLAVSGIALLSVALSRADVSRVVPLTSAYPVVTVVLSVLFLSERVTATRVAGTLLVVVGVGVLSR